MPAHQTLGEGGGRGGGRGKGRGERGEGRGKKQQILWCYISTTLDSGVMIVSIASLLMTGRVTVLSVRGI